MPGVQTPDVTSKNCLCFTSQREMMAFPFPQNTMLPQGALQADQQKDVSGLLREFPHLPRNPQKNGNLRPAI